MTLNRIFSNKVITKLMSRLIDKSENEKLEMGFGICSNTKMTTTKTCVGKKCKMLLAIDCPHGEHIVADFHTHPTPSIRIPSTPDIFSSIAHKNKIICIGNKEKPNQRYISCYEHPFGIPENKITEFNKLDNDKKLNYKDYNSKYKEYIKKFKKYHESRSKLDYDLLQKAHKDLDRAKNILNTSAEKYTKSKEDIKRIIDFAIIKIKPSCEKIIKSS